MFLINGHFGFLKGVDFTWTLIHMYKPMLFVSTLLLVLFFIIDNYYYKKDFYHNQNYNPDSLGKIQINKEKIIDEIIKNVEQEVEETTEEAVEEASSKQIKLSISFEK